MGEKECGAMQEGYKIQNTDGSIQLGSILSINSENDEYQCGQYFGHRRL